jgi:putative membrane protein
MWPGHGMHMGGMWLWWLLAIAILLLVVWAVARAARPSGAARSADSPEATLKGRYARGEIDQAEYERRLRDLRK